MSDDFLLVDGGVESANPREGFEMTTPSVTYREASGDLDLTISGQTYTASTISRSEQAISSAGGGSAMVVKLPVTHPLVQRYLANGVPPRQILVTIRRQEGALVEQVWCGYVTSISCAKHDASLLVPSRSSETFKRPLPVYGTGRACPHVLYDANCKVDRTSFAVSTLVASHRGRTVSIASIAGKPDHWALGGELLHVPSSERMTVLDQVGVVVTIQAPIFELVDGDAIVLYAGCLHDIGPSCRDKFNNVINYGGFPDLPRGNPFVPGGLGIIQS